MVLLNLEEPVKENAGLRAKKAGQGPIREDRESQTQVCEPLLPAERSRFYFQQGTASVSSFSRDLAADFLSFPMMLKLYKGDSLKMANHVEKEKLSHKLRTAFPE